MFSGGAGVRGGSREEAALGFPTDGVEENERYNSYLMINV